MAPEYGATCGIFPIDAETLATCASPAARRNRSRWSRPTPRPRACGTRRCAEAGLHRHPRARPRPRSSRALAGPKRPQDRVRCSVRVKALASHRSWAAVDPSALEQLRRATRAAGRATRGRRIWANPDAATHEGRSIATRAATIATLPRLGGDRRHHLCTNTSNPIGDARRRDARAKCGRKGPQGQALGQDQPRRPARKVVTDYLRRRRPADRSRASSASTLVGYGCTTCIGNSGPLPGDRRGHRRGDLVAAAVLSGNRNFEGRVTRSARQLPGLAAAGGRLRARRHASTSTSRRAARHGIRRPPVYLKDIWPSQRGDRRTVAGVTRDVRFGYADVFAGDERWQSSVPRAIFAWDDSTYVRNRRIFETWANAARPRSNRHRRRARAGGARRLDHHRPHLAGRQRSRRTARPGKYLIEHGVKPADFNSYGSRRGNHEVMVRGTFANIRLRNQLAPGSRGRRHPPPARRSADEHLRRRRCVRADGVPLVVLAGKEYGTGSSRDWAAKGPTCSACGR
jgi:aconitate hydratase